MCSVEGMRGESFPVMKRTDVELRICAPVRARGTAQHVTRPVVGVPETAVLRHCPLGPRERLRHSELVKPAVEMLGEGSRPGIIDAPERGDDLCRTGGNRLGKSQRGGAKDRVRRPVVCCAGLATGEEHQPAPDREPHDLVDLEAAIVVRGR